RRRAPPAWRARRVYALRRQAGRGGCSCSSELLPEIEPIVSGLLSANLRLTRTELVSREEVLSARVPEARTGDHVAQHLEGVPARRELERSRRDDRCRARATHTSAHILCQ